VYQSLRSKSGHGTAQFEVYLDELMYKITQIQNISGIMNTNEQY